MLRPTNLDFRTWWVGPTRLVIDCETLERPRPEEGIRFWEGCEVMNMTAALSGFLAFEMGDAMTIAMR